MASSSSLPASLKIASGKVRDLYSVPSSPGTLLFVASDRVSAFDVVLETPIPDKGALLNCISEFWFSLLPTLPPFSSSSSPATATTPPAATATITITPIPPLRTHFVALGVPDSLAVGLTPEARRDLDARSMQVRRLRMLPLEVIVRGYLAGSAWKEYADKGTVHGIALPAGLRRCESLPTGPLYTPSTKAPAGQHDENIHPSEAARIVGPALAGRIERLALAVYAAAARHAEQRGILIADTKFEFGIDDETGELVLADEVLTPDSSRFWDKARYVVGEDQDSLDKQVIRNWLTAQGVGSRRPVRLPQEVVWETEQRYKDVYARLTGRKFGEGAADEN